MTIRNESNYRKYKRLRNQANQAIKLIQSIMDTTNNRDFIPTDKLTNEAIYVYQFCRDFPKQIECVFHLLDELEKISKQNRHSMLLTDEQLDEILLLRNYKVPHAEIARKFNISYPTLKKYLAISQNSKATKVE